MKIFITGASGFVGKNLIEKLGSTYTFEIFNRFDLKIDTEIVIHLAGKAHDLKKLADPYEYYEVNTELTKQVFNSFLNSKASIFIFLSSVKASADQVEGELDEENIPNPQTHYGKSKLLAEEYILSHPSIGKKVFILRPCMIHGPGNKGNLNLLFEFVRWGIPWPLGSFSNKRSFCTIDNLLFVIEELLKRNDIPSGVYQIADDQPLSTNDVIKLIAESLGKQVSIWNVPKLLVNGIARLGDWIDLPLNSDRLNKLTQNYVVSNDKITTVLGKKMPITSREGILRTISKFKKN